MSIPRHENTPRGGLEVKRLDPKSAKFKAIAAAMGAPVSELAEPRVTAAEVKMVRGVLTDRWLELEELARRAELGSALRVHLVIVRLVAKGIVDTDNEGKKRRARLRIVRDVLTRDEARTEIQREVLLALRRNAPRWASVRELAERLRTTIPSVHNALRRLTRRAAVRRRSRDARTFEYTTTTTSEHDTTTTRKTREGPCQAPLKSRSSAPSSVMGAPTAHAESLPLHS